MRMQDSAQRRLRSLPFGSRMRTFGRGWCLRAALASFLATCSAFTPNRAGHVNPSQHKLFSWTLHPPHAASYDYRSGLSRSFRRSRRPERQRHISRQALDYIGEAPTTSLVASLGLVDVIRSATQSLLFALPTKLAFIVLTNFLAAAAINTGKSVFEVGKVAAKSRDSDLDFGLLSLCILVDLIGDTSFIVPGIGETEDLFWAPISAFVVGRLFNSNSLVCMSFSCIEGKRRGSLFAVRVMMG